MRRILKKHRETEQREQEPAIIEREQQQIEKLPAATKKIKDFLGSNQE